MNFWQEHPRLATVVALAVGVGTVVFLYVLSAVGGPAHKSDLTVAGSVAQKTAGSGAAGGSKAAIEQVDFSQVLAPALTGGKSVRSTRFLDLKGDGQEEALILVRGQGARRPLDWYVYGLANAGKAVKLLERQGVAAGEVQVQGPQLVESEGVYAPGDRDCCPSAEKRTYYAWASGSLTAFKTEAAPPPS